MNTSKQYLFVIVVVIVLFSLVQFSAAQTRFSFKGSSNCTPNVTTPCILDFDDPNIWSYIVKKRSGEEIQGSGYSPATYEDPYEVYIPYQYADSNYILETHNTTGYYVQQIIYQQNPVKRNAQESMGVTWAPGFQIIFKDTTLFAFEYFEFGSPLSVHQLIFENTNIHLFNQEPSAHNCPQHLSSILHFKGTTKAEINCAYLMNYNTTVIIDKEASVTNYNPAGLISYESASPPAQTTVNIHGNATAPIFTWFVTGNSVIDLTGATITINGGSSDEFALGTEGFIGTSSADNGKVTRINKLSVQRYQGDLLPFIISHKTEAHLGLTYLRNGKIIVEDGSTLYVPAPDSAPQNFIFGITSYLEIKGDSKVYVNRNISIENNKKRNVEEIGEVLVEADFNITIYDGLLEFNEMVSIVTDGTNFRAKQASSVLTFNGIFHDGNEEYSPDGFSNFELAAGSTVSFNNEYSRPNKSLPSNGVKYEFGAHTYQSPSPPSLSVTNNGSIKLKGSLFKGINITVQDSTFGGEGEVENDVKFVKTTGTPNLVLPGIGKTLSIGGKLTLPTGTKITVSVNNVNCSKLVVGTLDISSSATFEILLEGNAPIQDKTYVVAQYTTLVGQLPASPDVQTYQVENDTTNKQIKIHYIYTPPPTEPVATNNPSAASSSFTAVSLFFMMFFVVFSTLF